MFEQDNTIGEPTLTVMGASLIRRLQARFDGIQNPGQRRPTSVITVLPTLVRDGITAGATL